MLLDLFSGVKNILMNLQYLVAGQPGSQFGLVFGRKRVRFPGIL
jgi:hypothetical protein